MFESGVLTKPSTALHAVEERAARLCAAVREATAAEPRRSAAAQAPTPQAPTPQAPTPQAPTPQASGFEGPGSRLPDLPGPPAPAPLLAHQDELRRDEPGEACEQIAATAPGAALAAMIEALLSPLLVPAAGPAGPMGRSPAGLPDAPGMPASSGGDGVAPAMRPPADLAADLAAGCAAGQGPEAGIAQRAAGLTVLPSDMIQDSGLLALGAEALSELVAACHRLGSWAAWAESMAAACLAQSPEFRTGPAPWGAQGASPRFVTPEENRFTTSSEIACRLGISRTRAGQILERGEALMSPELGPTEALHRSGLLDGAKTALVIGRLDGAEAHTALAIQDEVLPRAPRRTHAQLARDLDRALVAHDPEGSSQRRQRNVRGRHVGRPRSAGEGVSRMSLLMPTMDAFLLDATLDAIAASARAVGDDRTPAQLRADALTAMTLTTLRTSQDAACAPTGAPIGEWPRGRAGEPVSEPVREPVRERTGEKRRFGEGEQGRAVAPEGPGRADQGRAVAPEHPGRAAGTPLARARRPGPHGDPMLSSRPMPDGVPLEGLLVSLSGLMSSTSPWWMPSGEQALHLPPGLQVRVDVTVPLDHLLPHADAGPDAGTGADASSTGVGGASGTGHDRGADPGSGPPPDPHPDCGPPPGVIAETADADTRLPAGSAASRDTTAPAIAPAAAPAARGAAPAIAPAAEPVAEVVIGSRRSPIPARLARALAAGGPWRRLVTDPLTGAVLDAGRRRYRPAQDLAERVRLRDQSCTHPGCEAPARGCDLDHITPWSAGGATSLDNLTALCEAHHRLKHTPGWSLTRTPDGALTWRTPTGARYRREVDGTIHLLPRRLGPHSRPHRGGSVPAPLSQEITGPLLERLSSALPGPRPTTAVLETRGPGPGQCAGAFEPAAYPRAAHLLGLAPLLDAAPRF